MKTPRPSRSSHATALASHYSEPCTPNSVGVEKIPAQWTWHHRTLMHLRDRLQQAHAEHTSQAVAPQEKNHDDAADLAEAMMERDLLWAELGAESDKLLEVDGALQRIRDGVYGLCEETGRPIPPERLRALPWTRYCRAAAEAHEAHP